MPNSSELSLKHYIKQSIDHQTKPAGQLNITRYIKQYGVCILLLHYAIRIYLYRPSIAILLILNYRIKLRFLDDVLTNSGIGSAEHAVSLDR